MIDQVEWLLMKSVVPTGIRIVLILSVLLSLKLSSCRALSTCAPLKQCIADGTKPSQITGLLIGRCVQCTYIERWQSHLCNTTESASAVYQTFVCIWTGGF